MLQVKKETLRLLDTFIDKSEDSELVLSKFVPPLLDPVLGDYVRSIPEARDPEVRFSWFLGCSMGARFLVDPLVNAASGMHTPLYVHSNR